MASRKKPVRRAKRRGRKKKKQRKFFFKKWLFILFLLLIAALALYTVWLDFRIKSEFEGRRWSVPGRVYARPLEIFPGKEISQKQFEQELKLTGYRPVRRVSRSGFYSRNKHHYEIQTHGFHFWDGEETPRKIRVSFSGDSISQIRTLKGDSSPLIRLKPALIGHFYPGHNEDRILVKLDEVPQSLIDALLATEDKEFFSHHGISYKGIARAIWQNLMAGSAVQGGSTLTQQLVKNYFLTHERTLSRKVTEAIMAYLLEWHYDKNEILQAYINEVYMGQQGKHGIHGFGLAAHYYFDRPLGDLRLNEIALLVGMVKGANYYEPRRNSKRALKRRNLVIDLMQQQHKISSNEANRAKKLRLGVVKNSPGALSRFPGFLQLVKKQVIEDYDEEDLRTEGLQIHTTLDPSIQLAAENALTILPELEKRKRSVKAGTQAAIVVTNPQSGEITALVGGRLPKDGGFNRALLASRQIGSLVKPAVYLAALSSNGDKTAISKLSDRKVSIKQADGTLWQPQNYDHKQHGDVPLHQALANSLNLATVNLGMQTGLHKVIDILERAGVKQDIPAYPSVLLGAINLTPLEVSQVYQTYANNGFKIALRTIREVTDATNKPLSRYRISVAQTLEPSAVYILDTLLQEAYRKGTGKSVYPTIAGKPAMAGKTGTTDDLRDSWYAGFGKDILGVVWLGHDDNSPAGLTGAGGALQVWGKMMQQIKPAGWQAGLPDDVDWFWVDKNQEKVTDESCADGLQYPFIKGSQPEYESCSFW